MAGRRRRAGIAGAVLTALVAAVALPSCGGGGGGSGYEVVASFSRAVALYEGADVLVMGIDVGDVTAIEIAGDGIDVTMSIDEEVPLPDDATAAIVPSSLIGERTVVLGPAWRDGDVLADGDRIPVERTIIPVEPDEALESVTELLQSLDPESVRRLLSEGSGALEGNGRTLNQALGELAQLVPYLAEQDDELLAIAGDVNVLADVIRARDTEVGELLVDFAAVSSALAEERDSLARFLTSLTSLTMQGEDLLAAYEDSLPEDMDTLAAVALTVQANGDAVRQLLLSLREFQVGVIEAYDPVHGSVRARVYTSQTLLNPIMEILLELGLVPSPDGPSPVPTVPLPTIPVPTIPTPTIPPPTIPPPTVPDPGDELCVPLLDPGCDG